MTEFEFTLNYRLPSSDDEPEIYLGQLIESGCDDAIIGIGQQGTIALQFNREADSAVKAVFSAMVNVRNAIPGAQFIEATPDFVGVSDIAGFLGFTRQNMRKLISTHAASFPSPVHSGKTAFWHLSTVLQWFEQVQEREVEEALKEIAFVNMQANIARESAISDPGVLSEVREAMAIAV